jgi:MT-A70
MQGIDKNLAHQARVLGRWTRPRSSARLRTRGARPDVAQERAERRARTALGGSVADLHELISSSFRAGVIAVDPPWPFTPWSERAAHNATDHYEVMTIETIKALPIQALAADDCALFMWATWPRRNRRGARRPGSKASAIAG